MSRQDELINAHVMGNISLEQNSGLHTVLLMSTGTFATFMKSYMWSREN